MATMQNKDIVRRYIDEVFSKGQLAACLPRSACRH